MRQLELVFLQCAVFMCCLPFPFVVTFSHYCPGFHSLWAVGAIIGHLIMGYNLSIISMMGLLALSGVVVNDALVLITYANAAPPVFRCGKQCTMPIRRFRPILLTTVTTFAAWPQ